MLTMEMVLHKDVDFAPKFGKNQHKGIFLLRLRKKIFRLREFKFCLREISLDFLKPYY